MKVKRSTKKQIKVPLYQELQDVQFCNENKKARNKRTKKQIDDEVEHQQIDPRTSEKILKIIEHQKNEEIEDFNDFLKETEELRIGSDEMSEDNHSQNSLDFEDSDNDKCNENFVVQKKKQVQDINLSDIVMQKILEKENNSIGTSKSGLHPKVYKVYKKVGLLLKRYKSGKLPKPFKIIPNLKNWEQVILATEPDDWTPQATYEAVRTFFPAFSKLQAYKFCQHVLLKKIRDDIRLNKKLNYHLYHSLKKALNNPSAFFKGILLPLCRENCSLKEAVVIGSIISTLTINMLHSAAALMKLSQMKYSGATSLFIRILIEKKYALPYKVVDSLVFHFADYKNEENPMPVLWHQSLLAFVQQYKQDLTPDQKELLLSVIKVQNHHEISPEISNEITNSTCRGEIVDIDMD